MTAQAVAQAAPQLVALAAPLVQGATPVLAEAPAQTLAEALELSTAEARPAAEAQVPPPVQNLELTALFQALETRLLAPPFRRAQCPPALDTQALVAHVTLAAVHVRPSRLIMAVQLGLQWHSTRRLPSPPLVHPHSQELPKSLAPTLRHTLGPLPPVTRALPPLVTPAAMPAPPPPLPSAIGVAPPWRRTLRPLVQVTGPLVAIAVVPVPSLHRALEERPAPPWRGTPPNTPLPTRALVPRAAQAAAQMPAPPRASAAGVAPP